MHYYKRNLGDYAKKAGRLSMLQHGSYTLLIDACYDREAFPTLDEAIEWTWASTTEEIEAVTFVLRKFFTLEDGVYVQNRIKDEISEYHRKSKMNSRIAIERETKRNENSTTRARTVDEPSPELHEPPPNQEPRTKNQYKNNTTVERVGVTEKVNTREVAQKPPVDGLELDVWIRWETYRREIRRPLKPASILAAQHKLAAFGVDQKAVVDQSIANGWQGLFALKSQGMPTGGNGHGKPRKLSTVERATAGRIAAELEIDELERQAHTAALGEDGAHLPRHMGATLR